MSKSARNTLSSILLISALGCLASLVMGTESAHRTGEEVAFPAILWPVLPGMIFLQSSIRLARGTRIRGVGGWLREVTRNAAALLLMAGAWLCGFCFSLAEGGGQRMLCAVLMLLFWACFAGWLWLVSGGLSEAR